MARTKVFVGNLSFKTQNADLAREFEVAGKVATANIISRGSRSLGYGFVEFETLEEANKAVELLNKKLIDNREINVEVARPRDETAPREPRAPRPRRAPRAPRQNQGDNNNNGSPVPEGQQGQQRQQQQGQQGGEEGARRPRGPRKPRPARRAPGAEGGAAASPKEGGASTSPNPRRERRPRQPRPAGDRPPRVASANTLFVANLPFSVDDAGLSEIFAGLNLKSAHVVRKRNDRSKGFGFVEFNNADDQSKALAAVDKKKVQDRELIVKVAVTGENQPREGGNGSGSASPKPANANAPAATSSPAVGSPKTN